MDHPAEQNMVSVLCTYDAELAGIAAEWLGDNKIPCVRRCDRERGCSETIELFVPFSYARQAHAILDDWRKFREVVVEAPKVSEKYRRVFGTQAICVWLIANGIAFAIEVVTQDDLWFAKTWPVLLAVLGGVVAVRTYAYWRRLQVLGYDWVSLSDANDILWRVGRKAHAIPSAAELEILPGFTRTAECMIRFLKERGDA
ncbi:MAG: hypothetical protein ABFD69_03430 [Candidatus Sumerlaeia bacterium]